MEGIYLKQLKPRLLADAQPAQSVLQRLFAVTRQQICFGQVEQGQTHNAFIADFAGNLQVVMQRLDGPIGVTRFKIDIGQVIVGVGHTPLIANTLCDIKLFVHIVERFGEVADLVIDAGNPIKHIGQAITDLKRFENALRFE